MSRNPEPAELPAVIDRYQIRAVLGQGVFGTVYRAFDPHLDREVAVKVLRPELTTSTQAVERFLREAQAAAKLFHPHIVPVHDAGRAGADYYITYAFIQGQTLADAIPESGMEPHRALQLTVQLASALGHAYRQGLLHRNVKPQNILLDEQGSLYLMDFGLAAFLQDEGTHVRAIMDAPAYLAPEQVSGETEQIGPAADIWSAGVVLYELLTGRRPFEGHPPVLVWKILNEAAPPPSHRGPLLDGRLDAICMKALAKAPAERYQTGDEMAAALRGVPAAAMESFVVFDEPASAPPVPKANSHPSEPDRASEETVDPWASLPIERSRRQKPRRSWRIAAACTAALAAAACGALPLVLRSPAPQTAAKPDTPPPPPPPSPPPRIATTSGTVVAVDKDSLALSTNVGLQTFSVPAAAVVRIDDKESKLSNLQKDGTATVTTRNGVVEEVKATNPPPKITKTSGTVVAVDKDSLALSTNVGLQTFSVPAAAVVRIDDKESKLSNLQKDGTATVTTRNGVVEEVKAANPPPKIVTTAGTVFAVDKDSLALSTNAGLQTFSVPAAAVVRIDDKESNLSNLHKDGTATVTTRNGVVEEVKATNPPPKITKTSGKVVAVDKDRLTLRGGDGKVADMSVPPAATVRIDEKDGPLAKVRKSATATVTMRDGVVTAVDATNPPPPAPARAPFEEGEAAGLQQDWADYLGLPVEQEVKLSAGVTMKLRLIPPGRFRMGSPTTDPARWGEECPQHEVTISQPFYMAVCPVTKGQFAAFMGSEHYTTDAENKNSKCTWRNPGFDGYTQTDDDPVVGVSWNDAEKFREWLSARDKQTFDLPTEAEWEYACRAGTTTVYFFGDGTRALGEYAWCKDNSGGHTRPVGGKKANPFGLCDMVGNVWQWCQDGYGPYQKEDIIDPKGDDNSPHRVLHGGCWYSEPRTCRSAARYDDKPSEYGTACGFRVVLRPPTRTP